MPELEDDGVGRFSGGGEASSKFKLQIVGWVVGEGRETAGEPE